MIAFGCPNQYINDCCLETPEQIWYLIARALNGEASGSELEELRNYLDQDESLQQQYDLLVRIWKEKSEDDKDDDQITAGDTISRIINRAINESNEEESSAKGRRRRRKSIFRAGSSLALLLIAGWIWKKNNVSSAVIEKAGKETIVTQKGSRTRSLLADGTTVWLNVGSKLYYENDFNGTTREVRLEGEAFFDVVRQANRPFIVHTSGIDIRVLGTAFNVKSYPEDKNVETTLYRGLVQVLRHEDSLNQPIQLTPNHKLVVPKQAAIEKAKLSEDNRLSVKSNSPVLTSIDSTKKESERIETAWRYNRLEFNGDNFEEAAKKLERWYNVSIFFEDEKVKQLNGLIGTFESETVAEAFAALKEAYPIKFKIINNHEIFVESSQ